MVRQELTADTEVVLLLCGRFGGERQEPFQPLSAREYGEFAKWINARSLRPADLLIGSGRNELEVVYEARLERKRIDFLLGRGTALALALERWDRGGLWVISRGDPEFPKRLKRHLKHAAPPLLYGAGEKSLLEQGGLAIIGSRDATEAALEYTRSIAAKCASDGLSVVSGGARGIDAAAMQGVTEAGGCCIGVLASDLLKMSVNRQNREGLQQGRMVLVSPFGPEAGFNAGNAMGRNRYIYALADQALVIDSALRSGGTWEGAVENLEHGWVPLYVRMPGEGAGNEALVERGGKPFTLQPNAMGALTEFFARAAESSGRTDDSAHQAALPLSGDLESPDSSAQLQPTVGAANASILPTSPTSDAPWTRAVQNEASSACDATDAPHAHPQSGGLDMFTDFTAKLDRLLSQGPASEEAVAEALCIEKGQARAWLKRACQTGTVVKLKNPIRYILGRQAPLC